MAGGRPTTYIYGLSDPRGGGIRYIGKANNPRLRMYGHLCSASKKYTKLAIWIRGLLSENVVPLMEILEIVDISEWESKEKDWISKHRAASLDLLNMQNGGQDPDSSMQTKIANGKANAKKVHGNPSRKRLWQLKQKLGLLIKAGYVSESTKAKIRKASITHPEIFGLWSNI